MNEIGQTPKAGITETTFEEMMAMPLRQAVPFNIQWLDDLTVGGIAEGESLLFLAPSGGATTALATQVAWAVAQDSFRAIFFAFDERWKQVAARFQALTTGVPQDEFEATLLKKMPCSVQEKFQEACQVLSRFVYPFNMTMSDGSGVKRDFPDDLSLTTVVSSLHDYISPSRLDKRIPGIPSPCGALRTASKPHSRAREGAFFRSGTDRLRCPLAFRVISAATRVI